MSDIVKCPDEACTRLFLFRFHPQTHFNRKQTLRRCKVGTNGRPSTTLPKRRLAHMATWQSTDRRHGRQTGSIHHRQRHHPLFGPHRQRIRQSNLLGHRRGAARQHLAGVFIFVQQPLRKHFAHPVRVYRRDPFKSLPPGKKIIVVSVSSQQRLHRNSRRS